MRENSEKGKLILLLSIIAAFIILVFFLTRTIPPILYTPTQIEAILSTVSLVVPDTDISVDLLNGTSKFVIDGAEGNVSLGEPYLSVKTADGYDIFSVMTYSTAGDGEFTAIAMFQERSGITIYRNSYPIGDSIIVDKLIGPTAEQEGSYVVNVNYLDRKEGEPMSNSPTVEKIIELQIENDKITSRENL